MDVSTAFAVVVSADGSRHKVCWTSDDTLTAIDELAADGGKPVVFHRQRQPQSSSQHVTGNVTGPLVMANVIHGEVRL